MRHLLDLAQAYAAFADKLLQEASASEVHGHDEALWPEPAGPKELIRLAADCRRLAQHPDYDLPDRRPARELLTDDVKRDRALAASVVEEALMEGWPGRPAPHTRIDQEEWSRLTAALAVLSEKERQAYLLVKGRELTHRQAAREMQTSAGNIYNLLSRAEAKIRGWREGTRTNPPMDDQAVANMRLFVLSGGWAEKSHSKPAAGLHRKTQTASSLVSLIKAAMEAVNACLAG